MPNSALNDLDYGQFGDIQYDPERKTWTAERALHTAYPIEPFGPYEIYVSPSLAQSSENPSNAATRWDAVQSLVSTLPQFQPGVENIYEFLSDDLLENDTHPEFTSDLLAFGRARQMDRPNSPPSHVIAIPTGSYSDKVLLLEARRGLTGRVDYPETRSGFRAPWSGAVDSENAVSGVWGGDGGRIRQICFSPETKNSIMLLAVRTTTAIHILHPLISTQATEFNPLRLLRMPSKGKVQCADMAFCPWNPSLLAAIDTNGGFVVWNIQYVGQACKVSVSGQYGLSEEVEKSESTPLSTEEWSRILWVRRASSPHTPFLVLASRLNLRFFDMSGHFLGESDLSLKSRSIECVLLDVRRNPIHDDEIFLATTHSILWLRVQPYESGLPVKKLLSWKHHRDLHDKMLRLTLVKGYNDLHVLLYSRRNFLISTYCATKSQSAAAVFLQNATSQCIWRGGGVLNIEFLETSYAGKHEIAMHEDFKLWQAITLGDDLSLTARRFYLQISTGQLNAPPPWTLVTAKATEFRVNEASEFLVDDSDEGLESGIDGLNRDATARYAKRFSTLPKSWLKASYSIPNERLYEILHELSSKRSLDLQDFMQDISQAIANGNSRENWGFNKLPFTVLDCLKMEDLDGAFKTASMLLDVSPRNEPNESDISLIRILASPNILRYQELTVNDSPLSLKLLYQRLLSVYNKSLASNVHRRARLAKERIVRQVASALFLASITVEDPSQGGNMDSSTKLNSPFAAVQETATQTIDVIHDSSQPSMAPPADAFRDSIGRLSKYAEFSRALNHRAHSSATKSSISEITDHWTLGANPFEYSFHDMKTALSAPAATQVTTVSGVTQNNDERMNSKTRSQRERTRTNETGDAKRRKIYSQGASSQLTSNVQTTSPRSSPVPSSQMMPQSQYSNSSVTVPEIESSQASAPRHKGYFELSQRQHIKSESLQNARQVEQARQGGRNSSQMGEGTQLSLRDLPPKKRRPGF